MRFKYLSSLTDRNLKKIGDVLSDERLIRHLWIELILNHELVNEIVSFMDNASVKKSLEDALSWYIAFKWILPENKSLEQLYQAGKVIPYKVRLQIYKEKKRSFIKGLVYAGLC